MAVARNEFEQRVSRMKQAVWVLGAGLGICLALLSYFAISMNRELGTLSHELRALRDVYSGARQGEATADQSASGSQTEDRLNALEQIVQDLGANTKALSAGLVKLQKANAVHEQEGPSDQQANTDTELPPRTVESTQALLEQALDTSYDHDPAWAVATASKVDQLFQEVPELAIAESAQTTCGGELCKITAILPANAADQADLFHLTLVQRLAADLPRAMTKVDHLQDGAKRYTVYMARAGYWLPTEGGGLMDQQSAEPNR